eukprot:3216336-Rhodomonas_salina.1
MHDQKLVFPATHSINCPTKSRNEALPGPATGFGSREDLRPPPAPPAPPAPPVEFAGGDCLGEETPGGFLKDPGGDGVALFPNSCLGDLLFGVGCGLP